LTAKNALSTAPPYAVERALRRLGSNLRTARLRRNLTIEEVAGKISTGPRPISDAEKCKPCTGAVVYVALLWTYDLLGQMTGVADSAHDEVGLSMSSSRERERVRDDEEVDRDF
jgi:hypothetical protein